MGILKEFVSLEEAATIDYARFALFPHEGTAVKGGAEYQFTLLDKEKFLKTKLQDFKPNRISSEIVSFVVAMVQMSQRPYIGNCNGAWSVGAAARNPKYPGYGRLLYAMASSFVAAPITSDKFTGTSDDAKAVWVKIDSDPLFKKTVEFDHFDKATGKDKGRSWYRRDEKTGSYTKAEGPRTETTKDDCKLPLDPKENTPFAYKSTQSFDFDALDNGLNEMIAHAQKALGLEEAQFLRMINDAGTMLFGQVYESSKKPMTNESIGTQRPFAFESIVQYKKAGNLNKLTEASLGRVYSMFQSMKQGKPDSSFAMLTSQRQSFSALENDERFEHLKGMIRGMGLGFVRLDGYWKECADPNVPYDECPPEKKKLGQEKSLFIPGITLTQAKHLMETFDQDAVVYAGPEVNNKVSLVFRVDGNIIELGDFTPGNLGDAWSELKGKAFHFEWVAQSYTEKLIESLFN